MEEDTSAGARQREGHSAAPQRNNVVNTMVQYRRSGNKPHSDEPTAMEPNAGTGPEPTCVVVRGTNRTVK